jgi:cephalosporin hydroxylase
MPGTPIITIDLEQGWIREGNLVHALGSEQGFALMARTWLRAGWDAKYVYRFTWLGRPVIQLPEDLMRVQEAIYAVRPTVVIETGVAHGGSLVFYASLLQAIGGGRVIGIDIDIRAHNRRALEQHELAGMIVLLDGSSTDRRVVDRVRTLLEPSDRVLVVLDSDHTKDHVRAELEAYAPLVTYGSYLVIMDGVVEDLAGAPRTSPHWAWDNPAAATRDFLASHPEFEVAQPPPPFNEGVQSPDPTYWKTGWLRRIPP